VNSPLPEEPSCYQAIIESGRICVSPSCDDLVRGYFKHDSVEFEAVKGKITIKSGGSLFEPQATDTSTSLSVGFAASVIALIRSAGHEVVIDDRRTVPSLTGEGDREDAPAVEQKYPGLLDAIATQRMGLIELPRGRGRYAAIARLCRTFAQDQILVIATTHDRIREIHSALHQMGVRSCFIVRGNDPVPDDRVIVGTLATLRHANALNFHVVLFENADEACSDETTEILKCEWNERRYFAFRSGTTDNSR